MRFKVGDRIVMGKEADIRYGITKTGSRGKVVELDEIVEDDDKQCYEIRFSVVTPNGKPQLRNEVFGGICGKYMLLDNSLEEECKALKAKLIAGVE